MRARAGVKLLMPTGSGAALRERLEIPEGQNLIDELARCFVLAAVTRLLKERSLVENVQPTETI
jgi:hypothetical protein